MNQRIDKIATWYVKKCVKLLRRIGYTVPRVYRNKRAPAVFAAVVPAGVAVLSVFLISKATIPMLLVHVGNLFYNYLLAYLEHEKFKKEHAKTSAFSGTLVCKVHAERCKVIATIAVVSILIPLLAVLTPDNVPMNTAIWLCAFADIIVTCFLNIINGLVLWSGAGIDVKKMV